MIVSPTNGWSSPACCPLGTRSDAAPSCRRRVLTVDPHLPPPPRQTPFIGLRGRLSTLARAQASGRFVGANSLVSQSGSQRVWGAVGGLRLLAKHWFIPEDVTPDYYHFTAWRMFQRFIAATINVFGTQVGGDVVGGSPRRATPALERVGEVPAALSVSSCLGQWLSAALGPVA